MIRPSTHIRILDFDDDFRSCCQSARNLTLHLVYVVQCGRSILKVIGTSGFSVEHRMKGLYLYAHGVVKTSNLFILRRCCTEHRKNMCSNACRTCSTCSTIVFRHMTNVVLYLDFCSTKRAL